MVVVFKIEKISSVLLICLEVCLNAMLLLVSLDPVENSNRYRVRVDSQSIHRLASRPRMEYP